MGSMLDMSIEQFDKVKHNNIRSINCYAILSSTYVRKRWIDNNNIDIAAIKVVQC